MVAEKKLNRNCIYKIVTADFLYTSTAINARCKSVFPSKKLSAYGQWLRSIFPNNFAYRNQNRYNFVSL
jgi:hypothetical protein